jgi:hypothetical protein
MKSFVFILLFFPAFEANRQAVGNLAGHVLSALRFEEIGACFV